MRCCYMNGAGNDFMVIDARGKELDFSKLAVELCKLTGADGFMAVDESEIADFKLHFYNADGSRGEMCGNGARCICRYAYDMGIVDEEMTVETDAGIVEGRRLSEDQYVVKLNDPSVLDLHRKEDVAYIELGDPGVPHAVKEVPGLSWEMADELKEMARVLRPALGISRRQLYHHAPLAVDATGLGVRILGAVGRPLHRDIIIIIYAVQADAFLEQPYAMRPLHHGDAPACRTLSSIGIQIQLYPLGRRRPQSEVGTIRIHPGAQGSIAVIFALKRFRIKPAFELRWGHLCFHSHASNSIPQDTAKRHPDGTRLFHIS